MSNINFSAVPEEMEVIEKIAKRATEVYSTHGVHLELLDVIMDITATHLNGCPLRLDELLNFPDFDFIHDISGIRQHLNRKTGALEHLFLPRSAA
nr:MAG TPA: TNF receptor-associated factor 3-interacting protein domain, interleukin 13 receptor [Caudoviricetes sp.]